jgi:hypothetical protein
MNVNFRQLTAAAFAIGIATLFFAESVFAAGVLQSMKGEVRLKVDPTKYGPAVQGQRIVTGTTVTTGPNSQAVIRFDKGALRIITGALGKRSASAFALRTPQATIGIRGTDFMVALVNPAYVSVTQGAVAVTNSAGTTVFAAGTVGSVASSTALATTIPASSLPAAASGAFSNMSTVTISAAGGTAGGAAGGATGSTAGAAAGTGIGAGAAVGAAAAAAAAAISNSSSPSTTTHH